MKSWPNLIIMFMEQAKTYGPKPFLWSKKDGEYKPSTWEDSSAIVSALARGLRSMGLKKGDRVILCSESRPEWVQGYFAIMAAGGIAVPAYTTNTPNDHSHIITDSGATGAIISSKELAKNFVPAANETKTINFLISVDEVEPTAKNSFETVLWKDLIQTGRDQKDDVSEYITNISEEDTALIIYTSGTGGAPKGVMLPHRAIMHNCRGVFDALEEILSENEVFLSFLPLSHSYEHIGGVCFPTYLGAEVYFAEGLEHLTKNMSEAKPTVMTAVPRLYELMHARIAKGVLAAGGLKATLFKKAVELGTKKFEGQSSLSIKERIQDAVVDKLVRGKIKATFGGRLKVLASGGAPLNPDIGMFFTALGLNLLQGYGQTESAPVISFNRPNKVKMETFGTPIMYTEVKIADDGEILVRGDLLMTGYWNNESATNDAIKDGWLHTGDIGVIDNENYIQITDRKKDIIVNSGGDNISPQRIEGFLTLEPGIAQAMVYGDKKPHIVALIVPDKEFVGEWAKLADKPNNPEDIINDPDFRTIISESIDRTNENLSVIERVRRFELTTEEFTVDNEMMTPTLKVRRHVITQKYGDKIEGLYRN
ncbi:MAG: long-chain fatty acid--CoA ligase [Pseudomonadota bacterium]|nr:long-chain fatty acid--CoA ligase [Pseudomonadota bacterium]